MYFIISQGSSPVNKRLQPLLLRAMSLGQYYVAHSELYKVYYFSITFQMGNMESRFEVLVAMPTVYGHGYNGLLTEATNGGQFTFRTVS